MRDPVRQMRLVVTANDYDEALAFYRDALGLRELASESMTPTLRSIRHPDRRSRHGRRPT